MSGDRDADAERGERRTGPFWGGVVLLMAAFVAAGLAGLDYLLPHVRDPDASLVPQSVALREGRVAAPQAWAKYPHLQSWILAYTSPHADDPAPDPADFSGDPEGELAAHLTHAGRLLADARRVVLLLSSLLLPLVFLVGLRLFPPAWALVATAFAASSLLLTSFALQARPHAGVAVFSTAALLACARLANAGERGRLVRYLIAALACALAVSSLHNGAFTLVGFAVAHLLVARGRGWRGQLPALTIVPLLACCALLFYPFVFEPPLEPTDYGESAAFPHRLPLERFNGSGFAKLVLFTYDYDPLLGALALLGLLVGASRLWRERGAMFHGERGRALAVWSAAVGAYVLALGAYEQIFHRFLLPLLPWMSLLAVAGLRAVLAPLRSRLLVVLLTLGALAFPAWLAARLQLLRTRPDTYEQAARWTHANLDRENERLLIAYQLTLPVFQGVPEGLVDDPLDSPIKHDWFKYVVGLKPDELAAPRWPVYFFNDQGRIPRDGLDFPRSEQDAVRVLENERPDYVLFELLSGRRARVFQPVRRRGKGVARFSPWADGQDFAEGIRYQNSVLWQRLVGARCIGPVLELYSFRRK